MLLLFAPLGNQLVGQGDSWSQIRKHAAQPVSKLPRGYHAKCPVRFDRHDEPISRLYGKATPKLGREHKAATVADDDGIRWLLFHVPNVQRIGIIPHLVIVGLQSDRSVMRVVVLTNAQAARRCLV
jgi:hypothetical protein